MLSALSAKLRLDRLLNNQANFCFQEITDLRAKTVEDDRKITICNEENASTQTDLEELKGYEKLSQQELEKLKSEAASNKKKIGDLTDQLFHANTVTNAACKVHYRIRQEKSKVEKKCRIFRQ